MSKYTPVLIAVAAILAIALSFAINYEIHNYYHRSLQRGPGSQHPFSEGATLTGDPAQTFDDLLDAIEWVESKGDPWAVGDNGKAVGSFQIHEIFFNDVKRIQLKRPATFSWSACMFRLKDRYDPKKSRQMVTIYLKYYGGTFEEMARKHNGGPNGHKKESTKAYWLKVKARMEDNLKVRIVEWKNN